MGRYSDISRSISLLLVLLSLYTGILMGGGSGPFLLYEAFWVCHCSDAQEVEDYLRNSEDGKQIEYALTGVDRLLRLNHDDSPDEFCTAGDDSSDTYKVCKKKLPLKYLALVLQNIHIMTVGPERLPLTIIFNLLYTGEDDRNNVLKGYYPITPPPPRYS